MLFKLECPEFGIQLLNAKQGVLNKSLTSGYESEKVLLFVKFIFQFKC